MNEGWILRGRALLLCALAGALLWACAPPEVGRDAGGWGPPAWDGGPAPSCEEEPTLLLGRCVRRSTGEYCSGFEEDGRFESFPDGGLLPLIVGPQGSAMFALAAKTGGIAPGDPERPFDTDNPELSISLHLEEGRPMATFRSRAAFSPVEGEEDVFENAQLLVIVDEPPNVLYGERLVAVARLRDSAGNLRCGELAFETPIP